MDDLPSSLFDNAVWHALRIEHSRFAVCAGDACRYPADVAPLAAVAAPVKSALKDLASLLAPGEAVWLAGEDFPPVPDLASDGVLECLQMVLPRAVVVPAAEIEANVELVPLLPVSAPEMVALTTLAFPGFFRSRTCEMGSYYGVRSEGQLIAMGGERLRLPGYPEISGVCTHPAHRGKGLASNLIWQPVRDHRREGHLSWLHVACGNRHATDLYLRMGFRTARQITLHRLSRNA
jgi:predicted GNAT family acetyltransferase